MTHSLDIVVFEQGGQYNSESDKDEASRAMMAVMAKAMW